MCWASGVAGDEGEPMCRYRERAGCRAAIERMGLVPFTTTDGLWDGVTVITTGATPAEMFSRASAGLRTQMRKMVAEGCWQGVRMASTREERRAVDAAYWAI